VETASQGGLTVKAARGGVTVKAPSRGPGSPTPGDSPVWAWAVSGWDGAPPIATFGLRGQSVRWSGIRPTEWWWRSRVHRARLSVRPLLVTRPGADFGGRCAEPNPEVRATAR
jgi:hypothetical protein